MQKSSNKERRPVDPLASRHIFLDTQVYYGLGHNPANRALALLQEHVAAHRVVLHLTDVTLQEMKRQIRERVLSRHRELIKIEKDFARWRKTAPRAAPKKSTEFDAEMLSAELFKELEEFLCIKCKVEIHRALNVSPVVVFERYFKRSPPFDGEDSKEFPDAFVVEALGSWCREKDERIYVVTEDKAMTRAVEEDTHLLALKSIHEVLICAAAELGAAGEEAGESAINQPAFDDSLETALHAQMSELVFVYTGELPDGEAYEGELLSIEEINDWSVVSLNDRRVTLILDMKVKVQVEIQYEDRDAAIYDHEDDRWYGVEIASTEVEDETDIEVLVEVERKTGMVREAKVLTQEVSIEGPSDWD